MQAAANQELVIEDIVTACNVDSKISAANARAKTSMILASNSKQHQQLIPGNLVLLHINEHQLHMPKSRP